MSSKTKYDAIVIGGGLSGLACALKLSLLGQEVLLLEQHFALGGLNSYYNRKDLELEVGLHAMTNFRGKGHLRHTPLGMTLKQLRISYDEIAPISQKKSQITFPSETLSFSNNPELLIAEVKDKFPSDFDDFISLFSEIENAPLPEGVTGFVSGRDYLDQKIKNPLLKEMLLLPLFFYGSSWENDIDQRQLSTLFKSLYQEGFFRPRGGVRSLLNLLETKLKNNNAKILLSHKVNKIQKDENGNIDLVVSDRQGNQLHFSAPSVFSSAGVCETELLISGTNPFQVGKLGFLEATFVTKERALSENTINFFSQSDSPRFCSPSSDFSLESGVLCLPNNFEEDDQKDKQIKLTALANQNYWFELAKNKDQYKNKKEEVLIVAKEKIQILLPSFSGEVIFSDLFTPHTIKRYTGKLGGAIYGSTDKQGKGSSSLPGVHIIGTDQGLLGITGAMLSGITIAYQSVASRGLS